MEGEKSGQLQHNLIALDVLVITRTMTNFKRLLFTVVLISQTTTMETLRPTLSTHN